MSDAIVRAGGIMSSITVRVKGLKTAIWRARIARVFFEVGALVAGCALEIELDDRRR